jgi:hypothetical protein
MRRQWAPTAPFATSFPLLPLSRPTLLRAVRPYPPAVRRYMPHLPFLTVGDLLLPTPPTPSVNTMAPLLPPPLLPHPPPAPPAMPFLGAVTAPADPHAPFSNPAVVLLPAPAGRPTAVAPPALVTNNAAIPAPFSRPRSGLPFLYSSATQQHPPLQSLHSLSYRRPFPLLASSSLLLPRIK